MPTYRLVFPHEPETSPGHSVAFTAADASEALLLAQRHDSPAQLWIGERQLCTLSRSGANEAFWIIS